MTEWNMEPESFGIRRLSNVHASWTENPERGAPGKFTIKLILSDGAEEYPYVPSAEDAKVHLQLLSRSDTAYFDTGRKVLIPSNVK
jgi:hypothetical protein